MNDVPSGPGNVLTWDGKNDEGKYVTPGVYRTKITAIDAEGNRSPEANSLLVIFY